MLRLHRSLPVTLLLSALAALPASAQYRRQVQELTPMFALTVSAGMLFPYVETITPVTTPEPEEPRRGRRSVDAAPFVSASFRYGRGLGLYVSGTFAFAGDAELTGADPLTGILLDGSTDVGLITIASAGLSFVPLSAVESLRLELGPAWVDLGSGGSYLGVRLGAAARLLEFGNTGGAFVAWDGYFAGGQDDRDGIEYQIRGGNLNSIRLGYEHSF